MVTSWLIGYAFSAFFLSVYLFLSLSHHILSWSSLVVDFPSGSSRIVFFQTVLHLLDPGLGIQSIIIIWRTCAYAFPSTQSKHFKGWWPGNSEPPALIQKISLTHDSLKASSIAWNSYCFTPDTVTSTLRKDAKGPQATYINALGRLWERFGYAITRPVATLLTQH